MRGFAIDHVRLISSRYRLWRLDMTRRGHWVQRSWQGRAVRSGSAAGGSSPWIAGHLGPPLVHARTEAPCSVTGRVKGNFRSYGRTYVRVCIRQSKWRASPLDLWYPGIPEVTQRLRLALPTYGLPRKTPRATLRILRSRVRLCCERVCSPRETHVGLPYFCAPVGTPSNWRDHLTRETKDEEHTCSRQPPRSSVCWLLELSMNWK